MRRSIVVAALLAAALGGGAGYVLAQGMPPGHRMPGGQMMQGQMPMQQGQMPMMQGMQPRGPGAAAPSSQAFARAMDKMHRDMAIEYSGNADRDFVAGMIPHHQGAIDMARIVLEHGKDEEVRKLAQEIIAAQEKEIAQMRAMLQRLPAQ
ncbi:DUF305 domain-containing protein [Elioraea tepidiphila]|jgi:uncharacterized protein (DUF305 family)|uniref:CopM family metallochaperone n=1 Tax=Elioraea tepidiphila TaxID=457934 RepID=UPI002FDAB56D